MLQKVHWLNYLLGWITKNVDKETNSFNLKYWISSKCVFFWDCRIDSEASSESLLTERIGLCVSTVVVWEEVSSEWLINDGNYQRSAIRESVTNSVGDWNTTLWGSNVLLSNSAGRASICNGAQFVIKCRFDNPFIRWIIRCRFILICLIFVLFLVFSVALANGKSSKVGKREVYNDDKSGSDSYKEDTEEYIGYTSSADNNDILISSTVYKLSTFAGGCPTHTATTNSYFVILNGQCFTLPNGNSIVVAVSQTVTGAFYPTSDCSGDQAYNFVSKAIETCFNVPAFFPAVKLTPSESTVGISIDTFAPKKF